MIMVLMNWFYITCIIYLAGSACMNLLIKAFGSKKEPNLFSVLFTGITVTTLYAQIFSVFSGVNMWANILPIIFCLLYLLLAKRSLAERIRVFGIKTMECLERRGKVFLSVLVIGGVMIAALLSAGQTKMLDTGWYHAQTIRWIEEYGSVKGVANLFIPLGFNSAQHYFDALFSMRFIFGQSMHATGGYFACLLMLHSLCRLAGWKKHRYHTADALAIAEMVYAIIITAFYADPYTDTLPNCLVLFIFAEWIGLLEEQREHGQKPGKEDIFSYGFLCLLGVYATIIKTSVVFVMLLTLYPAYLLIKEKEWKKIAGYLITGIAIIVPFFLTNIRTSGYLVFLAGKIDLFPVKWKVEKDILIHAVDSMIYDVRNIDAPMGEVIGDGIAWIPRWFLNGSISHQILYIGVLILIMFDLFYLFIRLIKRSKIDICMLLTRFTVYLGLIYWLFTLPQVRYCWAFLLFVLAVIPVWYVEEIGGGKLKSAGIMIKGAVILSSVILGMFTGFYGLRTLGYLKQNVPFYLIRQADYEKYEMVPVEKDGITFYIREEGGAIVCGYYVFPYLNDESMLEDIVVGDELRDGFYLSDE